MPGSAEACKTFFIRQFVRCNDIATVWDIGPGWATYATLAKMPGTTWVAVEIFEPYVTQYGLRGIYDKVIVDDFRNVETFDPKPDLMIFGDVLEHMPKADAYASVQKALDNSKNVYISVPLGHAPQGESFGNPAECHLFDFEEQDFLDTFGQHLVAKEQEFDQRCNLTIGAYWLCKSE